MIRALALGLVLVVMGANAQNVTFGDNLWCFVGIMVQNADGRAVFSNMTSTVCGYNEICVHWDLGSMGENGSYYRTQSGACVYGPAAYEIDLCEAARNASGVNFTDCTATPCNTTACNYFREPAGCREMTENDVKILPNCTLREALREVQTCTEILALGYPYHNQDQCINNVDAMIQCMSRTAMKCLNSSCFTVLDFLPGVRKAYRDALPFLQHVSSLDDVLNLLQGLGVDEFLVKGVIMQYVCPVPGVVPFLPSIDSLNIPDLENPLCDAAIVRDLVGAGLDFARQFYEATSQQQLCVSLTAFVARIERMLTTRCDLSNVHNLINNFLTGPLERLQPVVAKGIMIFQEMFANTTLPDCGVIPTTPFPSPTPTGQPEINCDYLYYSTRACDVRRAWFCDYARWRKDVVQPFFTTYFQWAYENGIEVPFETPTCNNYFSYDMCRNHYSRACFQDVAGCEFCYCTDHHYSNPEAILRQYKYDGGHWRRFLAAYKYVSYNNNGGCN